MELRLDPRKAAVVVIDMQNAFVHPEGTLGRDGSDVSAMQAAIPRVAELVKGARAAGAPDFWSLQQHLANDVTRTQRRVRSHTLKRFQPPALRSTWDAEIVEELQPLITPETFLFQKHRFSCFNDTTLATLLRMHGIDTVIIAGVATTTCVESTVRDAYMRDFDVIVAEDCVASFSPELHTASLRAISRYFGLVLPLSSVLTLLRGEAVTVPD